VVVGAEVCWGEGGCSGVVSVGGVWVGVWGGVFWVCGGGGGVGCVGGGVRGVGSVCKLVCMCACVCVHCI